MPPPPPPPPPVEPPPPQEATAPSVRAIAIIPSSAFQPCLRPGTRITRRQASTLPARYHGIRAPPGGFMPAVEAAVVAMVIVAVAALVPPMFTGVVLPKLTVGRYCAPCGLDVTAAVRATEPVNPPPGVTVMVEVLPVVAPEARLRAVPAIAIVGFAGIVSVPLTGMFTGAVKLPAVTVTFSVSGTLAPSAPVACGEKSMVSVQFAPCASAPALQSPVVPPASGKSAG